MSAVFRPLLALLFIIQVTVADTTSPSEEQVLQAIFIAFQPVDIFTASEIMQSRELLFVAAAEGNAEAMQVLDSIKSFADFFEAAPKKGSPSLVEQKLAIQNKIAG